MIVLQQRIVRYGLAGGLSMLTHLVVLLLLVEGLRFGAVAATSLGFAASVVVSFLLQHHWVFRSHSRMHLTAGPFLAVTLFGLLLNSSIMAIGHRLLGVHYLLVQAVAFAAVPVSNYLLNRAWTFAERDHCRSDHGNTRFFCLRWLYLLVPVAALLSMAAHSALHLDLARDLSIALDLSEGGDIVLQGPQLAGLLHLGPVWYWLLAWLILLGLSLPAVVLAVAGLGTLQFLVVARICDRLEQSKVATLWIALMCLPAWTLYQYVFITHPVLAAACVAALILFGLRFIEAGRWLDAAAVGLFYSLALHAHPSTIALLVLPAGLLVLGWRDRSPGLLPLIASAAAFVVPFLPWLIGQAGSGFPVFQGLADYGTRQGGALELDALMTLGWALTGGGTLYWMSDMLGASPMLARLMAGVVALLTLIGLVRSAGLAMEGNRFVGLMLLTLISGLVILVWLRQMQPYYMLGGLHLIWAGLVATGLARTRLRPIAVALLVVACSILLVSVFKVVDFQRYGRLPFAVFPLFDVTGEHMPPRSQPFLPVIAAPASGRWLCRQSDDTTIHGAYGLHLLHSFLVESRFSCGQTQLRVGGRQGRTHWVGLSRAVMRQAGIEPVEVIGGFGLARAVPVEHRSLSLQPALRRYPPAGVSFGPPHSTRFSLDPAPGLLVVTDYSFMLSHPPEVTARCGALELEPVASDNVSRVYASMNCLAPVEFEIVSAVPELIGIVGVNPRRDLIMDADGAGKSGRSGGRRAGAGIGR